MGVDLFGALDTLLKIETPEGVDLDLVLAGPGSRFLAWFIDFVLRLVAAFAISIPLGLLGGFGMGAFLIVLFLLEWFYPVLFEVLWQGTTPGKRLLGIQVLTTDGTALDWGNSAIRNLLRPADFFPFGYGIGLTALVLSPRFQRLGDLAADTVVVYRKSLVAKQERLPQVVPLSPPVPLQLEEQRAITSFAQRLPMFSKERAQELAEVIGPPLRNRDATDHKQDHVTYLCRLAAWFHGEKQPLRQLNTDSAVSTDPVPVEGATDPVPAEGATANSNPVKQAPPLNKESPRSDSAGGPSREGTSQGEDQ